MARDRENDVRKIYENSLGSELGSLFAELWQELTWLHVVWREYRVIFGTSPDALATANEAASDFFYIIQKSLWEGVLLHIARLTDSPTLGRKTNLSITHLPSLVRPDLKEKVAALVANAIEKSSFARDWRNRYIAHKDMQLALGSQSAPPLLDSSRAAVENALNALDEVLNSIDYDCNDTTTIFAGLDLMNGAERLLQVLKLGLTAELEEEKRSTHEWI